MIAPNMKKCSLSIEQEMRQFERSSALFSSNCQPMLSAIRDVRDEMMPILQNHLRQQHAEQVTLVMCEWLNNILKHPPALPSMIHIAMHQKDNGDYALVIRDDSTFFSKFHEYITRLPNLLDVESLDTGGMGLFLIHKYIPHAYYFQDGDDNCLILPLRKKAQEKARVLVIEDTPPMAMMIKKMLSGSYDVDIAYSGKQALDYMEQHPYGLVLCDIGLPDMNGIEIRQHMEREKTLNTIPFVFLTADESARLKQKAYDLGVDDYLNKPIDQKLLLNTANRILQRNHQLTHSIGRQLDAEATQRLIPALPERIGGYHTSLLFREASAGGGDMVIHFPRQDDELIIIADVTGHGAKAKYFSHLYSGYLYGLIKHLDSNAPPQDLMYQLNNMIESDDNLANNLLTCQMIVIKDGVLSIVSAGHPEPYLFDRKCGRLIQAEGTMPGLIADETYEAYDITLNEHQMVLVYTDGLLEGNRDAASQHKFSTWIESQTNLLNMSSLESAYFEHFGEVLHDDVTAILIRK